MDNKRNIQQYLDNIFGKDGVKTDIKVTLTDETLLKTSAYLVGTALVITVMVFGIRGVVNKMERVNQLKQG